MRRKDRERDQDFALGVLRACEYGTLATVNPDGTPYCIPISPVLVGETLYFHCALEGKKLDNLLNCDQVCLSCVSDTKLVPEKFSTEFDSAVVRGRGSLVLDEEEKIMALRGLCEKYASSNMQAFEKAIVASIARTGVCKITIDELSGKSKRYRK